MSVQLLVNLRVYREQFEMERYIGSDDIFALVKSGSFRFRREDGEEMTVGPYEGALFQKNVLYERKILSPVTMYLFRFRVDTPVFLREKVTFSDTVRIESTLSLLDRLDRGVIREEFSMRCALFSDILTQYAIENATDAPHHNADPKIEQAIAAISEALHKKLSLGEIAAQTGLSYAQFIRRFKQYTGCTPIDYVTSLRLQKAKQLLVETSLPIREIAYTCGFENEYYFSNFFKTHTNVSPTAFRNALI